MIKRIRVEIHGKVRTFDCEFTYNDLFTNIITLYDVDRNKFVPVSHVRIYDLIKEQIEKENFYEFTNGYGWEE